MLIMRSRTALFAAAACALACAVCPAQQPAHPFSQPPQSPGQQPTPPAQPPRPPQQAQPNPPRLVPPQGPVQPPPKTVSPIDPALDVRAAIDAAKAKARAESQRILVIWVTNPDGELSRNFADISRTADLQRLFGLEFVPVWVDAATGDKAASNRELARSLGADLKPGEVHPVLTVLDEQGKPVLSHPMSDLIDETRRGRVYSPLKIHDFLLASKAPSPAAQALLDAATARAAKEGKCVHLWFGEFGDEWSGKYRAWLEQPDVAALLGKYAVTAHIELLRDTGATDLMTQFGGTHVDSLPWWAILASDGRVIALSQSDKTPNIGFPTDEVEIRSFLAYLRQANPRLTDADAKAIRESLLAFNQRKAQ